MATLTFAAVNVNAPQLASEVRIGMSLSSLPTVGYVNGQLAVSHASLVAGNQAAVQTLVTSHVPNPLFGVTLRADNFTINGSALLSWVNMPAALTEAAGTRTRLPLYNAQFARLVCNVVTAGFAGSLLIAQVSLDGAAWTSGPQVSIGTTGLQVSALTAIPAQFQTDVFFRIAGQGGNAVVDPQFGLTTVQIA